jgi:ribosomal-protein-alanine N-acetyltransferase
LGCRNAVLEVRASNRGAQRLYSRFGFAPVAVRKGYYADNNEDAIVMFLDDIAAQLPRHSESVP